MAQFKDNTVKNSLGNKIVMKLNRIAIFLLVPSMMFCSSSSQANLQNFNEPNTNNVIQSIKQRNIHIIQLGDSHTAADVMTDAMRVRLQGVLGDGGLGWSMPMFFAGQRLARFGYDNNVWQGISSRTVTNENYALGGFIAMPKFNGATLKIKDKIGGAPRQRIKVTLRQAPGDGRFEGIDASGKRFVLEAGRKDNSWQTVTFTATLPFTITSQQAERSAIAGWWAFSDQGTGAVVSALGINGAEISYMDRWAGWQKELSEIRPTLVILAYGTNEAFNNVSPDRVRELLKGKINQIRSASPTTAIMIVSAPETLRNTSGQCGVRPANLTAIQQVQREVAQTMHTLYWDWQQAMGGACTMKSWMAQGKANRDGVHFLIPGYQIIGQKMANDILNLSGISVNSNNTPNSYTPPANNNFNNPSTNPNTNRNSSMPVPIYHQGSGEICEYDENGKKKNCQKI